MARIVVFGLPVAFLMLIAFGVVIAFIVGSARVRSLAASAVSACVVIGAIVGVLFLFRTQRQTIQSERNLAKMAANQQDYIEHVDRLRDARSQVARETEETTDAGQELAEPKNTAEDSATKAEATSDEEMSIDVVTVSPPLIESEANQGTHRPLWVDATPVREGDIHTQVLSVGPYATPQECREELPAEAIRVAEEYNSWYLAQRYSAADPKLMRAPSVHIDPSDGAKVFSDTRQFKFGTMHYLHAQMEFDRAYRRRLDKCWQDTRVAARMTRVGLASGGVFGLLLTVYSFLKIDSLTRGLRARWLKYASVGTILALMTSGILLALRIPWL